MIEYINPNHLAANIKERLTKWKPYIWHVANTGSIYIKFPHWALGSIRIGDHTGRAKYHYKWEIRTDMEESDYAVRIIDGTYVFKPTAIDLLVEAFEKNAAHKNVKPGQVETWEQYKKINTPKWKAKKYKYQ
jgi:hypothetical protein